VVQQEAPEIDETLDDLSDALVAYGLDNKDGGERGVEFVPEIGLSFEKVKEGYTLKSLWQVITAS